MRPNRARRIERRSADLYHEVVPGIGIAGAGRGREIGAAAVGVEAALGITEEAGTRGEDIGRERRYGFHANNMS